MTTSASASAAACLAMAWLAAGAADNAGILARLAAGIEARQGIDFAAASLEPRSWEAEAAMARSLRLEASPGWRPPEGYYGDWRPELRASLTGPEFTGQARYTGGSGGEGTFGLGYLIRNQERRRAIGFDRLSSYSRARLGLDRKASLLEELQRILALRNALAGLEAEAGERERFAAYLDSLLARLKPYSDNLVVSPNSLNNLSALRGANAATLDVLRRQARLLLAEAGERSLVDTADFHALDVAELADSLEAGRRRFPSPRPSYRDRSDSVAAEMARVRLALARLGTDRLLLGVDMFGDGTGGDSPRAGLGIRLEWSAAFGIPGQPKPPRPGALPQREISPQDPGEAAGVAKRSADAVRDLRAAVESRIAEIRMGQAASVYAISENLGYMLSQSLQSVNFAQTLRGHSFAGIQSLEELGPRFRSSRP